MPLFRSALAGVFLSLAGWLPAAATTHPAPATEPPLPDGLYAEFTTPHGIFVTELYFEKAPLTCASFVGLAEGTIAPRAGQPFYTGLRWYRVVPGFVIQSGDPTFAPDKPESPDDPGHPYTYPDEFVPGLHHGQAGILSMANAGPDTNSSEFFVTLGDCTRLNYLHSVFGRTVRGLEVLPQIQPGDAFSIRIIRRGAAAGAFDASEATFRTRAAAAGRYAGAKDIGPAAHFDDADALLPVNVPRAKNFNFKLANFERTTGRKVYGRLFAKSPPAAEDERPGAFMRALAEKLGVARTGVLAVHFADENDWRLWIGDDVIPLLLGRPPAAGDLGPDGALHAAKSALIDAAVAEGDAAFAGQQLSSPADRPPPPNQRLKLQTDALLDRLLLKLEP